MRRQKQQESKKKQAERDERKKWQEYTSNNNHNVPVSTSANKKGSSPDMYIPDTPDQYPHLHITSTYTVFSRSKHDHVYLIKGGKDFEENIEKVLEYTDLPQSCRTYINNTFN